MPQRSGRFAVSGRWPFNSGCPHASWLQVGVVVTDGKIRGTAAVAIGQDAGRSAQLAQAEGSLAAARSFLFDAVTDVWGAACRGYEPSLPQQVGVGLTRPAHAGPARRP